MQSSDSPVKSFFYQLLISLCVLGILPVLYFLFNWAITILKNVNTAFSNYFYQKVADSLLFSPENFNFLFLIVIILIGTVCFYYITILYRYYLNSQIRRIKNSLTIVEVQKDIPQSELIKIYKYYKLQRKQIYVLLVGILVYTSIVMVSAIFFIRVTETSKKIERKMKIIELKLPPQEINKIKFDHYFLSSKEDYEKLDSIVQAKLDSINNKFRHKE